MASRLSAARSVMREIWRACASRCGLAALLVALLVPLAAHAAAPDIHAAIRSGDAQGVSDALKAGADPNATDGWGRTPLIVALQQRKPAIVELLAASGADVHATDSWGRTPLLVAAQMKNTAAVRLLLDKKSDVNAANRNDITPLIAAAQTGDAEAVRLLLQAGAATDRVDNLGWTALMWARNRGREDIARLLIEQGADAAKGKSAVPAAAAAARPRVSPAVDATRIVRGDPKAPITIYEYTDFQCPYCAHGARILDEVMARYEGRVRLVVKHLPLPLLHPMAMSCARYFEALSLQDAAKAWAFYDRVFADRAALAGGDAYLRRLAADLGADLQRLDKDLDGPTVRDRIAADLEESRRFRFDGVPAFVVDGEVIEGAQPAKRFDAAIDAAQRR